MHFNIWCHAMYAGSGAASPEPFPRCVTVLSYQSPPLSKPPFFLLENDSKAKSYLAGQPRSQSCHSLLAMNLFALPLGLPGCQTLKRVLGGGAKYVNNISPTPVLNLQER